MLRKAFVLFLLFLGYMTNASVANLDSRRLPVSSSFQSLEDTLDGVDYIFCINFGGSQSTLHLLDQEGNILPLQEKNGNTVEASIHSGGANINYIGIKGFEKIFRDFLNDLTLQKEHILLQDITDRSAIVASIAGLSREREKSVLTQSIANFGFATQNIYTSNDAELALELVDNTGLILISGGTQSICFGKNKENFIRVGGLGPFMGGEGSGYYIGLESIKAAIADELGWGIQTTLTEILRTQFQVADVYDLTYSINSKELTPYAISSIAPLVFKEAHNGDIVSKQIIDMAASELGKLLALGLKQLKQKKPLVYCLGGVFTSFDSPSFLEKILASSDALKEDDELTPLIVNIANKTPVLLIVKEALKNKNLDGYRELASLPIVPELSYSNSNRYQSIRNASTEKDREDTRHISKDFQESPEKALGKLVNVDYDVLKGFEFFCDNYLFDLNNLFYNTLGQGGRIFLVGAGSSGRIAVDLAARWTEFWHEKVGCNNCAFEYSVIGLIANGPSTFYSSNKTFENKEKYGFEAIEKFNPTEKDLCLLISSSGSTQFCIGAGKAAKKRGSQVCYWLNTENIPNYTKEFIESNTIHPMVVDIGPPAIPGSTRLQSTSLGLLCIGTALNLTAKKITQVNPVEVDILVSKYHKGYEDIQDSLVKKIPEINQIIQEQISVFSDPKANFFNIVDQTNKGYITYLASKYAIREVLFDLSEIPLAFSTNFPQTTQDTGVKKPEYQAFMLSSKDNLDCWQDLFNRSLTTKEKNCLDLIPLSQNLEGKGTFGHRPKGNGNILIGVLREDTCDEAELENLYHSFKQSKKLGGKTALLSTSSKSRKYNIPRLLQVVDYHIEIPLSFEDNLGLLSSLAIKQVLNLITNGTMIGMNKVYGNQIVDLTPSSEKTIDQSIRILKMILKNELPEINPLSEELLFHYITRAYKYKQLIETQQQYFSPSPIRLSLAMIKNKLPLDKAVESLKDNDGNLHKALF